MAVTWWAGKKTSSPRDFYAAGRSLSGLQNGFAIAGEYLSVASFLGITGLISLYGADGLVFTLGWLSACVFLLLVFAELLRNSGKFTLADVYASRLKSKPVRIMVVLSTLTISTFYLVAQMVAAGNIVHLMVGLPYETAIVFFGVLIVFYVSYGGMLGTSWVQIIKASLLLAGSFCLTVMVLSKFNFNPLLFFDTISAKHGQRFLEPGLYFDNSYEHLSLALALALGMAGMPHILMRLYTVPNSLAARASVTWATLLIGFFYIMTIVLGFGAAALLEFDFIAVEDPGGNLTTPLLALFLGGGAGSIGGETMMSLIVSIVLTTILAVAAGLILSSSGAVAHDLYVNVVKQGMLSEKSQLQVARMSSLGVGAAAIGLGLFFKGENVAHLVALAFAIAASTNVPVLVYTFFWKDFNTGGALAGMAAGLACSVGLILVGPIFFGQSAFFPLTNPGIISIPIGFLGGYLGSIWTNEPESAEHFSEVFVRTHTGIGSEP